MVITIVVFNNLKYKSENSGDVTAAGTGLGFFAGEGEVDFAGAFPAGVFMGQGQAQFNGDGQIQV